MLSSCTKPVYTSFETSNTKIVKTLRAFSVREFSTHKEKALAEEILRDKALVDCKEEYYKNDRKLQIHQYEISENAGLITIKNNIGDILFSTQGLGKTFEISYDKKYLGICDNKKVRVFGYN